MSDITRVSKSYALIVSRRLALRWLALIPTLWLSATGASALERITTLSEARAQLALPQYSADERRLVLEQVDTLMNQLYVNRELKIAQFGPSVDPLPRLNKIKAQALTLRSDDMHEGLAAVFNDLHDLHTNYVMPAPRSCAAAFIPLFFGEVRDGGVSRVVVQRLLDVRRDLAEGVQTGDELLAVNGEPLASVLTALRPLSVGANDEAMRFRAIEMLSLRVLKIHAMPTSDSVRLTLKTAAGVIEKQLPWLVLLDDTCMQNAARDSDGGDYEAGGDAWLWERDLFQERFNHIFGTPALVRKSRVGLAAAAPTDEVFEVHKLDSEAGRLGYIRIKAFSWRTQGLDLATVTEALRRSIENDLQDTRALIIDVRSNPGGTVPFAERIVQFFTPTAVAPNTFRLLAKPINEQIFFQANKRDNRWSESVRQAIAQASTYTTPLNVTTIRDANNKGQIWFKPVIVLTNAGCYSACDLFAAGMQDNNAALIVGTHATTGGGGANVVDHETLRKVMSRAQVNPFKELPHKQQIRLAWRQVIRSGKNLGKLIEGRGVVSDQVVPPTREDLGTGSPQLVRALGGLVTRLAPLYHSSLQVKPGGYVFLDNAAAASWQERGQGMDHLEVWSQGRRLVSRPLSITSDAMSEISIELPPLSYSWSDLPVDLIGYLNGKRVLHVVRTLAWRGAYTSLPPEGIHINFDDQTDNLSGLPLKTMLLRGDAGSGWTVAGGRLRVGRGPNYTSNVQARAMLPLQLDGKGGTLTFDLSLEAEPSYDSLSIYGINPATGARQNFYAASELEGTQQAKFNLPKDWERLDLIFDFESDENWNLKGPEIDNLKISP